MGLEFGGRLGVAAAVVGLPLAPLVADYGELVTRQREAGVRHVGEALIRPGGRLRVLDGLMVSGEGRRAWVRVDRAELLRLQGRTGAPPELRSLLALLGRVHEQDADGLRRVQLYQLVQLMQQQSRQPESADAQALGMDPDECRALAHAARTGPWLTTSQRWVAEALQDAWEQRQVRRAAGLLGELQSVTGLDRRLDRLAGLIREAGRSADEALEAARDAEAAGAVGTARSEYLHVVEVCSDEESGLHGLLRSHRPAETGDADGSAEATGADLRAEAAADGLVRLSWTVADADGPWRVLRVAQEHGRRASLVELSAAVADGGFTDLGAPPGREIRYAVLPLRDRRISGAPLVSYPLVVTPEVPGLQLADGPRSLRADWQWPPGATAAVLEWSGDDGRSGSQVVPRGAGAVGQCAADGLPPGDYRVRVGCRYPAPDGGQVESPGVHGRCTVLRWPEPVVEFNAAADAALGGVRFSWTGAADAEVRLVAWPDGPAPAPGTALRQPPAALDWPGSAEDPEVLLPPRGVVARVAAVAVIGELALVGPMLTVQMLGPISGLRIRRTGADAAGLVFDWPSDVARVRVAWEREGVPQECAVSRSTYLREGLEVGVGGAGTRIRVSPVPSSAAVPAALVIGSAEAEVPPDIVLSYRAVPGRRGRRRRGRGPAVLQVTLTAPAGVGTVTLPDFVLVAKPLDGDDGVRPLHPADGDTVLRLSGEQLFGAGRSEHGIGPGVCRPPYVLRGFLVGAQAASVRLEEPAPAELVVR